MLAVIQELIDYSKHHFSTEEDMFKEIEFDSKTLHKNEHNDFVEKFEGILQELNNPNFGIYRFSYEIMEEIYLYIIDWFLNHVTGIDRDLIPLLNEKK